MLTDPLAEAFYLVNTTVEDEADDYGYLFFPMGDKMLVHQVHGPADYEPQPEMLSKPEARKLWKKLTSMPGWEEGVPKYVHRDENKSRLPLRFFPEVLDAYQAACKDCNCPKDRPWREARRIMDRFRKGTLSYNDTVLELNKLRP